MMCLFSGKVFAMRPMDMRFTLLGATAVSLLLMSPAHAADVAPEIQFVSGTGEPGAGDLPETDDAAQDIETAHGGRLDNAQHDLEKLSDRMGDPRMQDSLAGAVERMTEAMLDLPVGKIAAAVEKSVPGANKGRKRIRANDTLADIAGRDADRLPEKLADGSRQMLGMMSGLAAAFATMMPEFEKMGDAIDESLDDFEDAVPKD